MGTKEQEDMADLLHSDRTENMAAEDQTGHGGTEGTMAADHIAVTELERTPGAVRNTDCERQEKHRTVRSSKLSLRAPGPRQATVPEAIFILDSRSQTVSVDLLCVSRIYCISLLTITSEAWVSIASCLHCLPWSLTLDVLHTVIDEAPKTVPPARHSPRHAVSLL